jgi:hypothetical protein
VLNIEAGFLWFNKFFEKFVNPLFDDICDEREFTYELEAVFDVLCRSISLFSKDLWSISSLETKLFW